jgi:hypothetical protein
MARMFAWRTTVVLAGLVGVALATSSASASVVGPVGVTVPGLACPAGTLHPDPNGTNYPSAEVEPWLAVNPSNPGQMLAVWQQDRWSDGGAGGDRAAYTTNGGTTWTQTAAAFSHCTGGNAANNGDYDRATDPWATIAPDGTAYAISLSLAFENFTPHEVAVARSTNGGATWSSPVTLRKDTSRTIGNDKESITADPGDSRFVYAIWDRIVAPNEKARGVQTDHTRASYGPTWLARTTNGGASWETARKIYDPADDGPGQGRNDQTIGNQIVVLPNGTLVDAFSWIHNDNAGHRKGLKIGLIRSFDKGATWEQHATLVAQDLTAGVNDPTTGAPLRTSDELPAFAVDRSSNSSTRGNLYAVWQDARFNGGNYDEIVFSRSTDGGSNWSAPKRISTPTGKPAFTPAIAVSSNGTIGVVHYDVRQDTSAGPLPTDVWITTSSNGGATWSEQHVSGPFDMTNAPDAGGYFTGDYMGLVAAGTAFHPLWAAAGAVKNDTDVYTATVTP